MGGMYHGDGPLGLNSYPAVNSFSAISAEAGVASKANPTAYSANAGLVNIYNQSRDAAGGRRVIIPRKLELIAHAVNTASTDFRLHFYRDDENRWASGGTELTGYPLAGSENDDFVQIAPAAQIKVGLLTLGNAGDDESVLWRAIVRNEIMALNDKLVIIWGGNGDTSVVASSEVTITNVPAMWLGPGQNLSIHELSAGPQSDDPLFQYNFWYEEVETPT